MRICKTFSLEVTDHVYRKVKFYLVNSTNAKTEWQFAHEDLRDHA